MLIREVRPHHFVPSSITIYSLTIGIDRAYLWRDGNRHHTKKLQFSRITFHKTVAPMLMSSLSGKLYRISATIMCTAIKVAALSKCLDLIKYDYRFIKPRPIMDSMSEYISNAFFVKWNFVFHSMAFFRISLHQKYLEMWQPIGMDVRQCEFI